MENANNEFCDTLKNYMKAIEIKMKIEKKSKNTIYAYNKTYNDFIDFCSQYYKVMTLKSIKEDDIYAFIQYKSDTMQKQGDISISTTNSIISHLKKLFKHIERNSDELYDFDKVFEDIKLKQPKRVPKGLTDEQKEKLCNFLNNMINVDATWKNYRDVLLIKILLHGGLRASEVISLTLGNIILEKDLYKFSFRGKGDKIRFTYIKENIIKNEIDMLNSISKSNPSLLIAHTVNNKPMSRVHLSKMINSVYKRAGLNGVTGVHILRHTAAKSLLASGVSIVTVQSLLGHSSIQTTAIYANPTEGMILKEMSNIK